MTATIITQDDLQQFKSEILEESKRYLQGEAPLKKNGLNPQRYVSF